MDSETSNNSTLGTASSSSSFISTPSILRNFRSDSKQTALKSSTSCSRSRHRWQQLCGILQPLSSRNSISDTRQKASAMGSGSLCSLNSRNMVPGANGLAQTRHSAADAEEDIVDGVLVVTGFAW